jgi:hypothetical protein
MVDLVDSVKAALSQEMTNFVINSVKLVPNLITALLLLLLGWVVAILAKRFVIKTLRILNFEKFLKNQSIDKSLGNNITISDVLALMLYYWVILVFVQAAVDKLYLGTITIVLTQVLNYVPLLAGAILILIGAALLGEFVKRRILQLGEKDPSVQMVSRGVKLFIVCIGIVMALGTAKFDNTLLQNLILAFAQAVFYGLALAFGLAFGLGGQEAARDWIKTLRIRFRV